jgi:hypothetical protein
MAVPSGGSLAAPGSKINNILSRLTSEQAAHESSSPLTPEQFTSQLVRLRMGIYILPKDTSSNHFLFTRNLAIDSGTCE